MLHTNSLKHTNTLKRTTSSTSKVLFSTSSKLSQDEEQVREDLNKLENEKIDLKDKYESNAQKLDDAHIDADGLLQKFIMLAANVLNPNNLANTTALQTITSRLHALNEDRNKRIAREREIDEESSDSDASEYDINKDYRRQKIRHHNFKTKLSTILFGNRVITNSATLSEDQKQKSEQLQDEEGKLSDDHSRDRLHQATLVEQYNNTKKQIAEKKSLLDDYADPSTEPGDFTSGDD